LSTGGVIRTVCSIVASGALAGWRAAPLGRAEPRHWPCAPMTAAPMAQMQRLPLRAAFAGIRRFRYRGIARRAFRSGCAGARFCRLLHCTGKRPRAPAPPPTATVLHPLARTRDLDRCGARGTCLVRACLVGSGRRLAVVRWSRPFVRRAFLGRGIGRCVAGAHDRFLLAALRASGTRTLASVYGREKCTSVTNVQRREMSRSASRATHATQTHDAIERRRISAAVALRTREPNPQSR
jgi:hypothetical protein